MTMSQPAPVRVLVVDDSAFMRKALSSMLASEPRLTVIGTARNGEEAIHKVAELKPDVVTLDVEMPGMGGLEALKQIMAQHPVPVVMVSSLTEDGARETLAALELGAVDYVPKHLNGLVTRITGIQEELIAKVLAAAGAAGKLRRRMPVPTSPRDGRPMAGRAAVPAAAQSLTATTVAATRGSRVVAIGCSTGGPQALQTILPQLPADFPAGIVMVQHMPKCFTKPFAERLNELCQITVREAQDGEVVEPGVALLAPGGVHLTVVRRRPTVVETALVPDTFGLLHVPSVDVLMRSVAEVYGERAIGVVLTGMGHDGLEGMRAIKAAKGRTVAQDEASCIVYGMPRAVIERGYADKVVPLDRLAGELINMV
jgi:two-component system chemotaxis response regulator CheB